MREPRFGHLVSLYEYIQQETPRPLFEPCQKPSSWLSVRAQQYKSTSIEVLLYSCARTKIRTWDRSSISRVLYQLSYSRICYIFNLLTVRTFEQSTSLHPLLTSSGHLRGRATQAIHAFDFNPLKSRQNEHIST